MNSLRNPNNLRHKWAGRAALLLLLLKLVACEPANADSMSGAIPTPPPPPTDTRCTTYDAKLGTIDLPGGQFVEIWQNEGNSFETVFAVPDSYSMTATRYDDAGQVLSTESFEDSTPGNGLGYGVPVINLFTAAKALLTFCRMN